MRNTEIDHGIKRAECLVFIPVGNQLKYVAWAVLERFQSPSTKFSVEGVGIGDTGSLCKLDGLVAIQGHKLHHQQLMWFHAVGCDALVVLFRSVKYWV